MPQSAYRYPESPYVIALQWTGSNLADFMTAGFTAANVAIAQDNTTLILGAQVAGYAEQQYVPVPQGAWVVSLVQVAALPSPLPTLASFAITVIDATTFAATYTPVPPPATTPPTTTPPATTPPSTPPTTTPTS